MSNSNNNPFGRVMEEEELMRSISSYSQSRRRHHDHHQPLMLINPTATEELQYQDTVVTTPFLTKTYELVDDQTTNHVVSWSKGNNSFVIWDVQMFSINILPRYFKHNNFSSFVRQLNTYGFRKTEIDIWEFANEDFLRGHKHLLGTIKRRKPPPYPPPPPPPHHHQPSGQNQDRPYVEVGRVSLNQEIDRQRRGKQILMEELVRARQQQQQTKSYLKEMELRLQTTENKQQQIMTFMSIALQDTNFLEQMTQIEKRKDAEEALIRNKRRRRTIDQQGPCSNNIVIGQRGFIHDHDNLYGVPINLQEQYTVKEDHGKLIVGEERSFDERFWEGVEDEIDALRYQNALESQNVGYHAQPFAQQFNYLHS